MQSEIFDSAIKQWTAAPKYSKHVFRYPVLATVSQAGYPEMRTVVLRAFDPKTMQFTIFTDSRSNKIKSLNNNPHAQLCFYDRRKFWQLLVQVELKQLSSQHEDFKQISGAATKDYTSLLAPGTPIGNPNELAYSDQENYFTKVVLQAQSIESLKLKRPNHVRVRFEKKSAWAGTYLSP